MRSGYFYRVARPESAKGVVRTRDLATPIEDSGRATRKPLADGYRRMAGSDAPAYIPCGWFPTA